MQHARMMQQMANARMGTQGEQKYQSEDGFLYSNNSLSAVRHVVLDELLEEPIYAPTSAVQQSTYAIHT